MVRKKGLISKFMAKQTLGINILSNISRSKGNQTMKFGQLIVYNRKNHTQNVEEKLFPDVFLKNQN